MTDKEYCMSSYLAFRYIEDDRKDFHDKLHHKNFRPVPSNEKIPVHTADDIDRAIERQFEKLRDKKLGILLSGGMDSGNLAAYMEGCDAYTFRFLGGSFQSEELERAELFAESYHLKLHYADISWKTVELYTDAVMEAKAAPVHSIEPQIFQAALQAKDDGIEMMIIGESSDLVFGGMDQLLGRDWLFDDFMDRYLFIKPDEVLNHPVSMQYLFERYRIDTDKINYRKFLDEVFAIESSGSYWNALGAAKMPYYDPYALLSMADELDLSRIRNGEPKYLIRELFAKKYPDIPIPC